MKKILLVEDNEDIQTQLKWGLSKTYEVFQAFNRQDAVKLFHKIQPNVITLDLGLPPDEDEATEGFACLNEIIEASPGTKVIVVTGNGERQNALKAIQMGAYDYYVKPVDINELMVIIQRAFYLSEIESENIQLHTMLEKNVGFGGMIGQSPQMQNMFDVIRKVASTDAAILITGESGTGKELVARAIHDRSAKREGPFVPINCGAIPETLLESELFGYEKGAFTGAYSMQKGKFEFAEKGTLFLDEIAEMPVQLQSKLLRFLQEKTIQRIGGRKDIEIDTRIIAATNTDLSKAIDEGIFRQDLFYRISVVAISVPPLRERGFDIQLIANMLLDRYKTMFRKRIKGFSTSTIDAIEKYPWPGNVRELENKIQKAVITADTNIIEPSNLGLGAEELNAAPDSEPGRYVGISLKEARKRLEIDLITSAVERHHGNIKRASEELGVSRPTMYDLIEKYKLPIKNSLK